MVELLTYTLFVLGFLWFADEILTLLDLKLGMLEANPIAKEALKHGRLYFTEFKLLTFIGYVFMILFINSLSSVFAIGLTVAATFMYLVVVIRNLIFYELA